MARAVKLNGSFVQICTASTLDGAGRRLAADEKKRGARRLNEEGKV